MHICKCQPRETKRGWLFNWGCGEGIVLEKKAVRKGSGGHAPKRRGTVHKNIKPQAGEAIASAKQQRLVSAGQTAEVQEWKLNAMVKISEEVKAAVPGTAATSPATAPAQPTAAQELIPADEWAAMLNGLDGDAEIPAELRKVDAAEEALWERLSSTRWVKKRGIDLDDGLSNKSTVASR